LLTLLLGSDWTVNRERVFFMLSEDVAQKKNGRILMVPELISHETERKLCACAGDTASRFAEVLTFTRLAKRVSDAAGFGAPECMDNGGRLVAMASATRQLHSKLKAYAAVETRPEFLNSLLNAVDEFKRCCISAADLRSASEKFQGSFAQKLEELALILEAYDSLCVRGKRDPRDQMTWLLEELEDCDFAKEHAFYIEGFPDFTRQHMAIVGHLIVNSPSVVVSLTCDDINTETPAFEKAAATAVELLNLAKQADIPFEIVKIQSTDRMVGEILPLLYQGKIQNVSPMLTTYRADSVFAECHNAAEIILSGVQSGCRYRDFSIVCTDMSVYGNTLSMVLSRYKIPLYLSGTEGILDRTVITTVLSAIDAVVGGFEQTDVLRYLKSALSPLDIATCDRVENYALLWNITGSRWENEWEYHPAGLSSTWTAQDRAYLRELNDARESALTPLFLLKKEMSEAKTVRDLVTAVYDFMNALVLDQRLQNLSHEMERTGDLRNAQILNQLWEILLSALEQLSDTLGETYWDVQTFTKLLKLLLSQYDVGTIPATLDAVMAGPVSAMRCQQPKHLLVLGASEGNFPAYSGSASIFTDQERTALRQMGVPLTGGALEGLQAEFAEIYDVFCGAENSVSVSYSGTQPAFLYRRLSALSGGERSVESLGIALSDSDEVAAFLNRNSAAEDANNLGIIRQFTEYARASEHCLGDISQDTVQNLYGCQLKLSASQIDKLADCRLAYFLKYGLRLKERKPASVDSAEFGTYVHAVLEATGRDVMACGGFHNISLEETLHIANGHSQEYIKEHFQQIDSQRLHYLFQRNTQELEMVVTELWHELKDSQFEPMDFELAFGMNEDLDAISINGKKMTALLRGFVDRVDTWEANGQVYYRVVDYKTGKKDFDYCDIYNGLGLQMLLYMYALNEIGRNRIGDNAVAAGVQYFPARAPIVSADGKPEAEEAQVAREKLWKRRGLLLADEDVLLAMEPGERPKRMPYARKKDGAISGDLADRRQIELLKAYVFALLGKMIDDVSSGYVDANPYTRGSRHDACAYCPYSAICRENADNGRRNYAAMSSVEFWQEIEKEVNGRG